MVASSPKHTEIKRKKTKKSEKNHKKKERASFFSPLHKQQSMAGRKNNSKRHPLDEWSDDDEFDDEPVHIGPEPGDSDYRALKITVYGGHCAWRNPKKKEKADPYVIITYQGETRETTQLYSTTHPKWNEVPNPSQPPSKQEIRKY